MTNDGQDAEKQGPPCTVGGTVNWCSHYGKRNEDSLKFFNGITISSCNFSSGYLPEENKNTNLKRHMHPMFITALLTKAMMWIQLKMSINWWTDKEDVIYIHIYVYIYIYVYIHTMEYHSAIKNEIWPFMTTQMDLECIMLSEINQTEKKYHTTSLVCGI